MLSTRLISQNSVSEMQSPSVSLYVAIWVIPWKWTNAAANTNIWNIVWLWNCRDRKYYDNI